MKKRFLFPSAADRWVHYSVPPSVDFIFHEQNDADQKRSIGFGSFVPYLEKDWTEFTFANEQLDLWISSDKRYFGLFLKTNRRDSLLVRLFMREKISGWGTYTTVDSFAFDEKNPRPSSRYTTSGPQLSEHKSNPLWRVEPVFKWNAECPADVSWCEATIERIAHELALKHFRLDDSFGNC